LVYEDNFGFSNISEPEERAIVPKGFEATVRARLIFMVCASTSHFCATGRSAQHPISALR
jgi:hypothetical protein